jgi:hypothetical protein
MILTVLILAFNLMKNIFPYLTMKKGTLLWVLLLCSCLACKKDEIEVYSAPDNIYFLTPAQSYTFAYTPEKQFDTMYLPVRISGKRVPFDRKFNVQVIADSSTAQAPTHYQPLEPFYTMPADSGLLFLPVIIYNTDTSLQSRSVRLSLELTPTEDFGVHLPTVTKATITFSSRLERPAWWDLWQDQLTDYSRVKHALYLAAVGRIELVADFSGENSFQIPYNLFVIDKFRRFLADPLAWVAAQSEYVLEKKSEGKYEFYNAGNPTKRYGLELNPADGKYYFMNENQQRVTIN